MKTKEQIEAHRRTCEHFNTTLLGDGRTCCTADLRALPTWQDPGGEWFVGSENHYEIIANEYPPILEQPRFVWDIMIKCVETGTLVLYRMIESPLNSMYLSK